MTSPQVCSLLTSITADEFNKIALGIVAIVALFLSPLMQWAIARRQTAVQSEIADRQVKIQADIAARQLEAQEQLAKRQLETQEQIARRQIADSIATKRQTWIDELRKDAAEYFKLLEHRWALKRPNDVGSLEDRKKRELDVVETTRRASELGIRITLRLNPTEEKHDKLRSLFRDLYAACGDPPPNASDAEQEADLKNFGEKRSSAVAQLQLILKEEWERVKRGEI